MNGKWWKLLVSHVVVAGSFLALGFWWGGCGEPKLLWLGAGVVEYKEKWYKEKCGEPQLEFIRKGDLFTFTCWDDCFSLTRDLKVECHGNRDSLMIMPGVNASFGIREGKFDALYGVDLSVYKTWGMFGFGGGFRWQHSPVFKTDYYGGSLAAVFKFDLGGKPIR